MKYQGITPRQAMLITGGEPEIRQGDRVRTESGTEGVFICFERHDTAWKKRFVMVIWCNDGTIGLYWPEFVHSIESSAV